MKYISLLLFIVVFSCNSQNREKAIYMLDKDSLSFNNSKKTVLLIPEDILHTIKQINSEYGVDNINKHKLFLLKLNNKTDIFFYKCYGDNGIIELHAFKKSVKTIKILNKKINIKWLEENESGFKNKLLDGELISLIDLDKKKMLIIRQRMHNGTAYNALIEHYVNLSDDNFDTLFSIESKSVVLLKDWCTIVRILEGSIVTVYSLCGNKKEIIGKFKLGEGNNILLEKEIYSPEMKNFLITSSGISDTLFLKEGYVR